MSHPQHPSVFVIGSSTTVLMHPHLQQMLAGRLDYDRKGGEPEAMAEAMRDLDVPTGANAGNSRRVLAYLGLLADRDFMPDAVVMHVGFHDIRTEVETGQKQVPLDEFVANVRAIIDWFIERGIRLIWMPAGPLDEALHNSRSKSFHRYEADLDAYNAAIEPILAERRIERIDLAGFTLSLGPLSQTLKDHVHFKDEIVEKQARYLADELIDLLEPSAPPLRDP